MPNFMKVITVIYEILFNLFRALVGVIVLGLIAGFFYLWLTYPVVITVICMVFIGWILGLIIIGD